MDRHPDRADGQRRGAQAETGINVDHHGLYGRHRRRNHETKLPGRGRQARDFPPRPGRDRELVPTQRRRRQAVAVEDRQGRGWQHQAIRHHPGGLSHRCHGRFFALRAGPDDREAGEAAKTRRPPLHRGVAADSRFLRRRRRRLQEQPAKHHLRGSEGPGRLHIAGGRSVLQRIPEGLGRAADHEGDRVVYRWKQRRDHHHQQQQQHRSPAGARGFERISHIVPPHHDCQTNQRREEQAASLSDQGTGRRDGEGSGRPRATKLRCDRKDPSGKTDPARVRLRCNSGTTVARQQ
mmetsp:Transcript_4600/g.10890  ORF Transcript_4600/g.10890 Transcript_4600/m.10890 type:complete len:293 (-) Transcript_4600:383-1261(-)